jgi:tRNA 2-selenouridine synthase
MPHGGRPRNLAAAYCAPLDRNVIEEVADIRLETQSLYGAIIDVRAPCEFAQDRIPGAVNLPVLSDAERAEVGAIYAKDSRFRARRVGAALIARNVARHLEGPLSDRDAKFRPLLYCWRGGMRSHAMAIILSQIGWRVGVLSGGYRTWRRAVVAALSEESEPLDLVLLDGQTGTAKTDLVRRLRACGAQTIDLEALAAHRGSVFGADLSRAQPSQKLFESLLFDELRRFDRSAPIVVEAESHRIGGLGLPKRLWRSMRAAPRIVVTAPLAERARYLVRAYQASLNDPAAAAASLDKLRPFHPKERIDEWRALLAGERFRELAERLMQEHYDPLYDRGRNRDSRPALATIDLRRLEDAELDRAAAGIATMLSARQKRSQRG